MTRTDRASLLVHAPGERVWAALVDREALERWLPPAGMTGRFESFDLREGGSYRLVLRYTEAAGAPGKTTADSDVSEVRIPRLVPGERIVQEVDFESDDPSVAGTMTMEWSLTADPEGTVVTFEARDVPPGVGAADHAAGLTSSLAQLAAHLQA